MPILVAGQHNRTTEASNGSPAEKPAIGWFFMLGGAAAMLYDHMSLYTYFVKINMSFKHSHVLSVSNKGNAILFDSSRA